MRETYRCDVCGKVEYDEYRIDIYHRGCRLAAAFPEAVLKTDAGIVALDVTKIAAMVAHPKAITDDGVEFERWPDGRVSISVRVRVSNTMSDWSWWLTNEEWAAVVAALTQHQESPA